ncbi:MAG: hypothetical protein RSA91_00500 [Bacilli bacterium]
MVRPKLDKVYICECTKEHRIKAILQAKMNYCYSCGKSIDKELVNKLLEEYKEEKKINK